MILFILGFANFGFANNNYQLKTGETLEYKVIVKSMIYGADQVIKVVGRENYKNHEVWRIRYNMYSVGLAKKMTNYSESEDLLLDVKGFFPWYIKKESQDKDDQEKEELFFDYDNATATRISSKNGSPEQQETISLPGYIQDGLSLQFYLRNSKLKPGINKLNFYSSGHIKEVNYQVSEVKESIKLNSGTYSKSYKIENEEIAITIIISDDDQRFPLIIRKDAKFGKVEARLEKVY